MTPEEKQHFEEFLVKAVQSGKKETSGLVDLVIHKQEDHIEKAINRLVNGKIDKANLKIDSMKEHLRQQDQTLKEIQEKLNATDKSLSMSQTQFWTAITVLIFLGGTIIYLGKSVLYNEINIRIGRKYLNFCIIVLLPLLEIAFTLLINGE